VNPDRPPWYERMSLRVRMVLVAAVAVTLVVAIGGALILLAVHNELVAAADDVAEGRASQIADLAEDGQLPAEIVSDDDLEAAAQVVRDGRVVSATDNAFDPGFFDLPELRPGFEEEYSVDRLMIDEDGPFRITSVGTETSEGDATVHVAVDVEDVNETLATLVRDGVVGLALLVVGRLGGGLGGPAGWYTAGLAVAMVAGACVQRRPWGLGIALTLQLAMVAGWFAHAALGGLGLLFVGVWGYLLYVRWAVARRMSSASRPGR